MTTPRDREQIIEKCSDINNVNNLESWLRNSTGNIVSINQNTGTTNGRSKSLPKRASTCSDYTNYDEFTLYQNDSDKDLFYYSPEKPHQEVPGDSININNDEINLAKKKTYDHQDCINLQMTPQTEDMIHFHLTTPTKDRDLMQAVKDRRHF